MKKLPVLITTGAMLLGSAAYVLAQDMGKNNDGGKHSGHHKTHKTRGLQKGKLAHMTRSRAVKTRSSRSKG
jgi:hypothetical protein